jgi:formylglycine-generating enzyme required for sulfatase activity
MEDRDEAFESLHSAGAAVPRFRVTREIERAGASLTCRGWDESLAREVVIRTVAEANAADPRDRTAERRLIDEALATGRLSQPGIVPVHELALDVHDRPYFTTRLLRGESFGDLLARLGRGERNFTLARAIEALRGACDTIAYAHSRGTAHGNLAPESVIVGEFGETYVTGWGVARNARPEDDVAAMGALLAKLLVVRGGRVAPPELAAIARKASARDAGAHYAGMAEVAADLRAWLERRVVRAHRTGALAELQKWVARNRATAALLLVALLVVVGGLVATETIAGAKNRELSATRDRIAGSLADIERLKALKSVRDLFAEADTLWPAVPEQLPAMRRWRDAAQKLADERPLHLARQADLEAHGLSDDPRAAWWHESLQQLVASLDRLTEEAPFRVGTLAEMARRIASAQTVEQRSLVDAAAEWRRAIAALAADPRFKSSFGGKAPFGEQLGLVPLGPDPQSGLWEFWDVDSGERPVRDPKSGRIVVQESMGLVFVLLPGVTLHFRRFSDRSGLPTFDPKAISSPLYRDVKLDPFFISKFEMTQGQWLQVTGTNPSGHAPGVSPCVERHDLTHPVELVSFEMVTATLRRLGWTVPTYAQWQYASRAGTSTIFWTGDDPASLEGAANVADQRFVTRLSGQGALGEKWNDGFFCTAPVGRFRPNPFGLYDTIGNVAEMAGDPPFIRNEVDFSPGDGGRRRRGAPPATNLVLLEGGSYTQLARAGSYGAASEFEVGEAADSVGVRPARKLRAHP